MSSSDSERIQQMLFHVSKTNHSFVRFYKSPAGNKVIIEKSKRQQQAFELYFLQLRLAVFPKYSLEMSHQLLTLGICSYGKQESLLFFSLFLATNRPKGMSNITPKESEMLQKQAQSILLY